MPEFEYQNATVSFERTSGRIKDEITFSLTNADGECHLILTSLWMPDDSCPDKDRHLRFQVGDYFQQTIKSSPEKKRLASLLTQYIIDNHEQELSFINNIYSTYPKEDGFAFTDSADLMWKSRVRNGIAEFDEKLNRYKLLF